MFGGSRPSQAASLSATGGRSRCRLALAQRDQIDDFERQAHESYAMSLSPSKKTQYGTAMMSD